MDGMSGLYARGMAYGHSDVKTDTMVFTFNDERFEFPTAVVFPVARYNGYFYEAPIDKLRELKKGT